MVSLDGPPPSDLMAEQAVIGALFLDPVPPKAGRRAGERESTWEKVADMNPADFYRPAHEMIFQAQSELIAIGVPCDPVAVNARLVELGISRQTGGAPYLHELMAATPVSANADYYAEIVRDKAVVRRTIDALLGSLQAAYSGEIHGEELLEKSETALAKVPSRDSGDYNTLMNIREFLSMHIPPTTWTIEGLVERGERAIVTGEEGLGKTTLMRQLAVCAAAGMDPFVGASSVPVKVLVIDVENPKKLMHHRFEDLVGAVTRRGYPLDENNLWIDRRMGGLDLSSAADRRWLARRVNLIQPDLLSIGPAYKLYDGRSGDKDEDIARTVTGVLDELRERHDMAILLEHHSPHGESDQHRTVRPFGSSLWRRWPEFGIGLQKVPGKGDDQKRDHKARRLCELVHWRGPRDERKWPERLESGGTSMPWVEAEPES